MKTKDSLTILGFTLVEVVIALLILAVGLIGVLALFPIGFDAAGRTVDITKATFFAQSIMEEIKKNGFDAAASGYTVAADPIYANFSYAVTVADVSAGLKQVDVEVTWPVGAANPKNVILSIFLADYEP